MKGTEAMGRKDSPSTVPPPSPSAALNGRMPHPAAVIRALTPTVAEWTDSDTEVAPPPTVPCPPVRPDPPVSAVVERPKDDGYRALHVVENRDGRQIEVQVRTERQHR